MDLGILNNLPWDQGLVKQIKDIFICDVLECNLVEENNQEEEKENYGT